jgi:hypothetical protein
MNEMVYLIGLLLALAFALGALVDANFKSLIAWSATIGFATLLVNAAL